MDYSRALYHDPNLAEAYASRGLAHWAESMLDQALTDCNEAIRLEPKFAQAYAIRGLVHWSAVIVDLAAPTPLW